MAIYLNATKDMKSSKNKLNEISDEDIQLFKKSYMRMMVRGAAFVSGLAIALIMTR